MSPYKSLKELLKKVIELEEKFSEFYDAALKTIEDEYCRQTLKILNEQHIKNLDIIKGIEIDNYGYNEWIQITPDLNIMDLPSKEKISDKTTTEEIAEVILDFEQKMKQIYSSISKEINDMGDKELFDSLVLFKDKQIYEIKRCIERW